MPIYCPKCGNKLEENFKFCPNCGKNLAGKFVFCPDCGKKMIPADKRMAPIPEKERLKSSIKITFIINQSIIREINKKTKASIDENCIIFFSLNLSWRKKFTCFALSRKSLTMLRAASAEY